MELTRAIDDDKIRIADILKEEGIEEKDAALGENESWVWREDGLLKGFFVYRKVLGMLYLIHFCVVQKYRTPSAFRQLLVHFKQMAKKEGHPFFIVGVLKEKKYLIRLARVYSKRKAYAEKDGQLYFLVNI